MAIMKVTKIFYFLSSKNGQFHNIHSYIKKVHMHYVLYTSIYAQGTNLKKGIYIQRSINYITNQTLPREYIQAGSQE